VFDRHSEITQDSASMYLVNRPGIAGGSQS
jgi:hypothetical protein